MGDPKGFLKHGRQAPRYQSVPLRIANHQEHIDYPEEGVIRTQASRCMDCGVPFCQTGCPLGNLIPEWNDLVYHGRWDEALKVLHATNNFPEFTGRVCPAPCESSCVLGINHDPVTIKLHEVSIVDRGFAMGRIKPRPPATRSDKTVGIIGGGPAGLAAAQQLNRAGHRVTVYEKSDRAGGLLMYGIPHYKLRKEAVQRRIDLLQAEGIEFRLGCEIGKDISPAELKAAHHALVLAIGAEHPRDLPVPGRELDGVHAAMEFLPQSNRHNWGDADIAALHPEGKKIWAAGKKVIVIGGGDTGSDCIGTSLRQGATSIDNFELLPEPPEQRRPDNPWPQWARIKRVSSSVEELRACGGKVHYALQTTRLTGRDGKLTGLETIDLDWSQGKPQPIAGSERRWDCDLVLLAMGFLGPRQAVPQALGCELDGRGNVIGDPSTRMTSVEGVFAAGDCRRGQSLVVWAIAEGREVARQVDAWLGAGPSRLSPVRLEAFAY